MKLISSYLKPSAPALPTSTRDLPIWVMASLMQPFKSNKVQVSFLPFSSGFRAARKAVAGQKCHVEYYKLNSDLENKTNLCSQALKRIIL